MDIKFIIEHDVDGYRRVVNYEDLMQWRKLEENLGKRIFGLSGILINDEYFKLKANSDIISVHGSYDYIMFAGETEDNLQPISAWKSVEEAIRNAYSLLDHKLHKYVEVTFMPEDDDDTNEIVWSNCERSNENAE